MQDTKPERQDISIWVVMELLDIALERPAIIFLTTIIMMVFMMMKVLECLSVMEDVDICLLRQTTIPLEVLEIIIVVIEVVMMLYVDMGLLRKATLPLLILDKELKLTGEVDMGLRPATLTPINKMAVVNS